MLVGSIEWLILIIGCISADETEAPPPPPPQDSKIININDPTNKFLKDCIGIILNKINNLF
jgi:hypothetical protein